MSKKNASHGHWTIENILVLATRLAAGRPLGSIRIPGFRRKAIESAKMRFCIREDSWEIHWTAQEVVSLISQAHRQQLTLSEIKIDGKSEELIERQLLVLGLLPYDGGKFTESEFKALIRELRKGKQVDYVLGIRRRTTRIYRELKRRGYGTDGRKLSKTKLQKKLDGRCVEWKKAQLDSLRQQRAKTNNPRSIRVEGQTYNAVVEKLKELNLHPSQWSAEQDDSLRTQAVSVASITLIKIQGKDLQSIKRRMRDLKIQDPASVPLTQDEINSVNEQLKTKAVSDVVLPFRSRSFVKQEIQRLKLCSKRRPWTNEQKEIVLQGIASGLKPEEIKVPGREPFGIRYMYFALKSGEA